MSWGFEIGRVYNRRSDIHARFGGQQQGGIITPRDHPLVIIITGEEGLQHGYADRLRPDEKVWTARRFYPLSDAGRIIYISTAAYPMNITGTGGDH